MRWTVDGESLDAGPGDVIVTPAGTPHSYEVLGDEPARVVCVDSPLRPMPPRRAFAGRIAPAPDNHELFTHVLALRNVMQHAGVTGTPVRPGHLKLRAAAPSSDWRSERTPGTSNRRSSATG